MTILQSQSCGYHSRSLKALGLDRETRNDWCNARAVIRVKPHGAKLLRWNKPRSQKVIFSARNEFQAPFFPLACFLLIENVKMRILAVGSNIIHQPFDATELTLCRF